MSLLQEKSGEREKRECGNPTSAATSGRSSQLARAQEAAPRTDAGVQTNKIKGAAKGSADASEKSSGEGDGKHRSQRRRAGEKVLIRLASSSFGGNYPGHISHTT